MATNFKEINNIAFEQASIYGAVITFLYDKKDNLFATLINGESDNGLLQTILNKYCSDEATLFIQDNNLASDEIANINIQALVYKYLKDEL